jgi:hypothetical protein
MFCQIPFFAWLDHGAGQQKDHSLLFFYGEGDPVAPESSADGAVVCFDEHFKRPGGRWLEASSGFFHEHLIGIVQLPKCSPWYFFG